MNYAWVTCILGPILLAQGFATRRRAPKLPEPPGEREGTRGTGPVLDLLIVGDSAAAGVGAAHQDQALLGCVVSNLERDFRVSWSLNAKTGATTEDTLARLDALPARRYDVAVTSLGVNDITGLIRRDPWRKQQAELRRVLRNKFDVSLVVISGLPPVHGFPALPQPLRWNLGLRAAQFNADLAVDVPADPGCEFLDLRFTEDEGLMAEDGFHPGPGIYAEWGSRVAQAVLEKRELLTTGTGRQ